MLGRLVKLFPQISQMKGFSPKREHGREDTTESGNSDTLIVH